MRTVSLRKTPCACTSLRRADRAICHLYDLVLAPTGMRATQFMILQIIAHAGEIAQCDLAREFAVSVESLSRRLGGARRSGLLQMRVGEHQSRVYSLTAKGVAEMQRVSPYWERAQLRLQQSLGPAGWNFLAEFADGLAEAAIEAETSSSVNGVGRSHTV